MTGDDELYDELMRLWHAAGRPSSRKLAAGAGMSHTSVVRYLKGEFPTQASLEAIVIALGGDPTWFRKRWVEAHGERTRSAPGRGRPQSEILEDILHVLLRIEERLNK